MAGLRARDNDANGGVRFTTVYPGWCAGRAVHMHFRVRTNPTGSRGLELTSQVFFDEALTDAVHAQAPYSSKRRRDTLVTTDSIYRSGGPVLLAPLSPAGGGYAGTFHVGVRA
jgi:protocatechuate 3,4-dioxygenase beta subunit